EPFQHPFAPRIKRAPIFDRAQPERLLQAGRRSRSRHATALRGVQVPRALLGLHVLDPRLDRRMRAGFGNLHDPGGPRGQINVSFLVSRSPAPPNSRSRDEPFENSVVIRYHGPEPDDARFDDAIALAFSPKMSGGASEDTRMRHFTMRNMFGWVGLAGLFV